MVKLPDGIRLKPRNVKPLVKVGEKPIEKKNVKPQLRLNPKKEFKKTSITVEKRSIQTRKKVYENVPITIRKRYTQKVTGYQLHVIWVYKCRQPNGKCGGPLHYTELGYGPSIKHIHKNTYIDGAGKKYTFKEMFAIAEHNAFTRDSILCSPCYTKIHSINIIKNVPIKTIKDNPNFNQADKPAIQEFNFKLNPNKGLKTMKEIYGHTISRNDYKVLHDIATGKLHIGEAEKRHERIFIKYGKIIKSIDEHEAQKKLKKDKENARIARKKRSEKPLKIREARKITENKPPTKKKMSKKVKEALKGYENKKM